jgi:hypothetical protein
VVSATLWLLYPLGAHPAEEIVKPILNESNLTFQLILLHQNIFLNILSPGGIDKGEAIPLLVWIVPVGSRRLRLPDLKTFGSWRW